MNDRREIESLVFSGHALHQMFSRGIATEDVRAVIDEGEAIASYPDDRPYPNELLVGFPASRPFHVVLAYNGTTRSGYVVTAYLPDPKFWSEDYKTRRKP